MLARCVFAALMSFLMSFFMTAWVTWLNLGFVPAYLQKWLQAFITAWPAAFIIVVLLAPSVQRMTRYLVSGRQASGTGTKIL